MAKKTISTVQKIARTVGKRRVPSRDASLEEPDSGSLDAGGTGTAGGGEARRRPWKGTPGGKHLVIVESPSKAKNINQYLGTDYVVKASIGHVRDLPTRAPKGSKQPVPGVDLEHEFEPTYEILPGKKSTVSELRRLAAKAEDVWFATDLDREGEAIAWHLAQEIGIPSDKAKRVVFNAVTKSEIQRAFSNPHGIDEARVNAQQARRILDRIVGYQVSPLLWKKVARGLSAGRVQSVAVRLVVEREREIRAFTPEEHWSITARFTAEIAKAAGLIDEWAKFMTPVKDAEGNSTVPTVKLQNAWMISHAAFKGELWEVDGRRVDVPRGEEDAEEDDEKKGTERAGRFLVIEDEQDAARLAQRAGLSAITRTTWIDEQGKGPARHRVELSGEVTPGTVFVIRSIDTKRTTSRPAAPFITSSLQQAASTRLGFGAQRTMRAAQGLYEGVDLPGRGTVGLITYMRTDSTHLSGEALSMVRDYIGGKFGRAYLPDRANVYSSSNKDAQEAHEAIRPTDVSIHPDQLSHAIKPDQAKLYRLIWERFVASQMSSAQWDAMAVTLHPSSDRGLLFRSTGRTLVFDGYYKVTGVPVSADEQRLPGLIEKQSVASFALEPQQKFTSPPARYTEASLIKVLEEEGIGRPSTYASIISTIQDRKYVEIRDRRLFATDLGEVVTDKLMDAFPDILNVGYTREMESELDRVESRELEWTRVLREFYGPFKKQLKVAHDTLTHAKAETQPAPDDIRCDKCGAATVYRFGKNGRFLSCSRYPDCDYAAPIDEHGRPRLVEEVDILCPKCGKPMQKRTGRFGPFLGCTGYPECDQILKLDKSGRPSAPQPPPVETDIPCPKCQSPLYLRSGKRGPWLSCSAFPKCRGRGAFHKLEKSVQERWEKALREHEKHHPIPIIRDRSGNALTDAAGRPIVVEGSGGAQAGGDGEPLTEVA